MGRYQGIDEDESLNELSGLYLVKCGNYYKIGMTNNISSRLSCLRICNPHNIELMIYRKVAYRDRTKELEEDMHYSLKEYRYRGEWFLLPEDIVVSVIKVIKLYGTRVDKTS